MNTVILENKKVKSGLNVQGLKAIADKFSKINAYIESGQPIPQELSKNFVSFPLSDDPYSELK
jgi:hypothetical protein